MLVTGTQESLFILLRQSELVLTMSRLSVTRESIATAEAIRSYRE